MPFERLEIETFPFFSLKLLIYATLNPQTHFTFSNAVKVAWQTPFLLKLQGKECGGTLRTGRCSLYRWPESLKRAEKCIFSELVRDTEVHTGLGRGRGREKERGEERDSGLTGNVGGGWSSCIFRGAAPTFEVLKGFPCSSLSASLGRQTPAQASLLRPCICLVAKWLFAPLSPHGIHLLGALHPQPRFHLFVSQHIVSSSPCARVEGSHPARPRSGIGNEWMIGSGHLCQGFGMLRSRSPVLMNVIYTYQMCHWVTCQIFYIMPFCRTRDSWGRECLLMPWGGSEHGFFFFLIRTSRHHPYTQSVPPALS